MRTKTALITGASSGIGTVFAQELATRQTNLVLVARSQDKLYQLAEQLQEKFSIQVEVIVQDLTESQGCQRVYGTVIEKGLEIDLLVNNAGFGDYGPFAERKLSRQVEMIQLNVVALVELTHLFLGTMQQRQSGAIINVASIAGFQPLPYLSTYAATKAFVLSFSEALWAENQKTGVRILALCPGPTESNFFKEAEFPTTLASKDKGNLVSAKSVVQDALKALESNTSNLVTGGLSNQVIVNISRFVPREFLASAIEKQFRG
ncbi:SDR family NAD(P)-dependent oxidoreductase [Aphanothece sacrum]|uniref:Short-chain dehydrogenase/reductase SDR n=1 Tax=Aphanothece sacrum FPU1 TaxID=1920663 RepID=A0A401IL61_APHSA|nr:SDR family oxidoreductase [Aphanothece sacrum]GBF81990.1 short-chain dehydrogenase/reductase SDR [Aphanothece sacrum FPU1]GBF83620.1 short-chain dehydrogenase/reductase SDR [Aphanothece sacrum FPU3]